MCTERLFEAVNRWVGDEKPRRTVRGHAIEEAEIRIRPGTGEVRLAVWLRSSIHEQMSALRRRVKDGFDDDNARDSDKYHDPTELGLPPRVAFADFASLDELLETAESGADIQFYFDDEKAEEETTIPCDWPRT